MLSGQQQGEACAAGEASAEKGMAAAVVWQWGLEGWRPGTEHIQDSDFLQDHATIYYCAFCQL